MRDIAADIERLSEQRRLAWACGDGQEAKRCGERIEALYEEKRASQASHGTEKKRALAIRRAKAEAEIDRLMQG